jgi:chromate transporter
MDDAVSIRSLFGAWLKIGCTSFGGGAVTQYLIQETFIYKHHWIGAEDYSRIIAMSQIAPGINILATTILIGKRLGGGMGIFVSLMGLVLPSAIITVGMTAIYVSLSSLSRVQAAMRYAFAAIFGLSLVTNWRNVAPILERNRRQGSATLAASIAVMIGTAVVYALLSPAVVILYVAGSLTSALVYRRAATKSPQRRTK